MVGAAAVAAALPLVGLASLLLRSQLDPHIENYRAHFVVFGAVGGLAFVLGYTAGEAFAERSAPAEVAELLNAYWGIAAPLITRTFGGELEKFIGDSIAATFNSRGDQADHALRAAQAALALQRELATLAEEHPEWPRLRVGVNSGEAVLREVGGDGHVGYPLVGDTINTGSRLERLAPAGGVLIGVGTYSRLPAGAVVEAKAGLRLRGKSAAVDAYLLYALP